MGLSIFTGTPYKTYGQYFEVENLNLLKEQWPPVKLFKLKKIFESNCTVVQGHNEKMLTFQSFLCILPELSPTNYCSYSEHHKKRLFDIFDRENLGNLTWNNFFLTYTLCEFGSPQLLAVVMFSIFDFNLRKKLSRNQLEQMLNKNSKYLKEDVSMQIDEQVALENLFKNKNWLSLEDWIDQSEIYLDYEKFRKIFNVWAQEELEKQLAQKFNELNTLYNDAKQKYVGYLVNYKWFQSWKTFIHKEYGIQINGFSNNLTYNRTMRTLRTQKSFRTKKTIKSIKSIRSSKSIHSVRSLKKGAQIPRLKAIGFDKKQNDHINQFNLIYSNISDRPSQIYNNLLQGQFSEILIPQLIENIHYIIVSQQIWRRLKLIYGAYPQFRRTGQKIIQIYPKNFKIFTKFHKGKIDYDQQKFLQFSNNALLFDLISKAIDIESEELQNFKIYYKTCNMFKWQQILNLNIRTAQISSQQIVFLAAVLLQQVEQFKSINCFSAQTTKDLHIGDQFIYIDPVEKTQKKAILMGRNNKKYIIHFKGQSYIYDICIEKEQFIQRSSLSRKAVESGKHKVKIQQIQLMSLPNSKGLGFINSVLLSLLNGEQMYRILPSFYRQQPQTLIQYLANIFQMLTGSQVRISRISDMIRIFFYEYSNFEFTMCQTFLQEFYDALYQSLKQLNYIEIQNVFTDYLVKVKRSWTCSNCKKNNIEKINLFCFNLPIPNEEVTYYQIIYVPYSYNFKGVDIKRYAFSLHKKATFKQYKQTFEKTAQLKNVYYVLAQIHGNNIIKNYLNAKDQASLQDLLLRQDDVIYAYELCFHLDSFVFDHYNNESSPKLKGLKVGQMIDFQKEKNNTLKFYSRKKVKIQEKKQKAENEKIWIFGKINKIDIQSYTHKWSIEIQYRQNRIDIVKENISPQKTNIAFFPTKSYLFADQYHLRLLNRVYNEVTNQMQLCNIPFVIMISNWMRMKEVELLVYQQIRHLIADSCSFKVSDEGLQQQQGQYKVNKKEKMKKFKDYLFNHGKPYKLIFTDLQGRCAICCKIQKSVLNQNQKDFICQGCHIDPQAPIFWQIRPYQTRICVDWQSLDSFQKPSILDDSSYISTKSARKSTIQTLDDCIRQRNKVLGELEECSCTQSGDASITYKQQISNVPQRLIFLFDRLIEQQTNYKRINKKYIHFQIDDMILNGQSYQLVAATSIQGSQVDARYLTYLRQKNSWLQYNGQHTRIVKKPVVQKICAILLQYKRVLKNEKKMTIIRE